MALIRALSGSSGGGGASFKNYYESSVPTTISLDFTPKYLMMTFIWNTNYIMSFVYDADISTTSFKRYYSSGNTYTDVNLGDILVSVQNKTITLDSGSVGLMKKLNVLACE